jgi:hypothetical protein
MPEAMPAVAEAPAGVAGVRRALARRHDVTSMLHQPNDPLADSPQVGGLSAVTGLPDWRSRAYLRRDNKSLCNPHEIAVVGQQSLASTSGQ